MERTFRTTPSDMDGHRKEKMKYNFVDGDGDDVGGRDYDVSQ